MVTEMLLILSPLNGKAQEIDDIPTKILKRNERNITNICFERYQVL